MHKNDRKQQREWIKALSLLSQVAITIVTCIMIGVLLGKWLDGLLGTGPWLLLFFSLLGMAAAFKALWDMTASP